MRERLDRVWPSLVALVGTVGVVVALLVMFGDDTEDGGDVVASDENGSVEDEHEPGTDEPGADETESTDDATDDPAGESDDDAEENGGEDGGDEPDPEPTTAPPELRSPVGIANQTSVEGLELRARDRLESGGWQVAATSGFNGTVPETTVYYPPGLEENARALSRQFPEIGRVEPTFDGINQERLVIILVDDYIDVVAE